MSIDAWPLQLLRIDITSLNPADNTRTVIDSAVKVCYTPAGTRQLLVTTTTNRLLKFDARTGKLLAEVSQGTWQRQGGMVLASRASEHLLDTQTLKKHP